MPSTRRSSHARRQSQRALATILAVIAVLVLAATALAAHPKAGARYSGFVASAPVNGFEPPVTFAVSGNGTTLTNFRYSSFGCFGAGGFQPGVDYYTKPQAIIKVGSVKVSKSGHFSAAGAVSTYTAFGNTTKTTSKVSGSFTSAKAAKGTISFGQKVTGKFKSSCGPAVLSFTVKVK